MDDFQTRRQVNLLAMEQARIEQNAREQVRRDAYLASMRILNLIYKGELLETSEVEKMTGLYGRKILRWEKENKFPQSIRYGKKHYWDKSEIENWVSQQP
jgi:predicted DNA-binding transcriptional regulator AlpA